MLKSNIVRLFRSNYVSNDALAHTFCLCTSSYATCSSLKDQALQRYRINTALKKKKIKIDSSLLFKHDLNAISFYLVLKCIYNTK